eukprot:jgi/Chlat1/450/Chrsp103S00973
MVAVRLALRLERAGEAFLEQALAVTDDGVHVLEAARRSVIERQSEEDARQLLACELGPDAAATPQDKNLWCLHADLIFIHARLVLAIGLREQRDKTETRYRHALQQWEVRQRSTGVYGPVTDSERRATERAIEKIRLTPPAIPKVETRLLEACGKNGYKRAVALACIAAVDNNNKDNNTRAAQLFHDSAQVLKACEAAEARLLEQHVGGSACVPRVVTRSDTCIAVVLDKGANTHAKSYAVYAKPTGSGVSVTAKNTSYKGTGGSGVPLGTVITISGLNPDEGYMLASGTYSSESDGAKPTIGESTPEIVALLPFPLTYLRARVALLARGRANMDPLLSRAFASPVAADVVTVPKYTLLDPPQGKVLVETKLREAPAAVLRAVSLLFLSGVNVYDESENNKEGRKCQLACVRECERLALALEAARALGSDPTTQRAAALLLYAHARGLPAPASARFLAAAYAGNANINNDKDTSLGREHAILVYELLRALRACRGGVRDGVTTALIIKGVDAGIPEAEALKKYILATTTTTTDSPPSTTNTPSTTTTTKSPSPDPTSSPDPYTTILPLLSSSPSSTASTTTKAYELLVSRWRDDDAVLELLVRICDKARAEGGAGAAVNIVKWGTDGVKRFADRSKVLYSERASAPTPDVKGGAKSSAAGGAKAASASVTKAGADTKDTKGGVDVGAVVSEEVTRDAAARVLQRGLRAASVRRKRVLNARAWARRQQPWVSRLLAIVGVAHYEGGTADAPAALRALAQSANTALSCGSHAQVQNACRYVANVLVRARKGGVEMDKNCALALRNALDSLLAMLEARRESAKSTTIAPTDDASDIGSDRDIPAWFEDRRDIHVAWCAHFAAKALDTLISTQRYRDVERLAVRFHCVTEGRFADILLPAAISAQRAIESEGEWQSELQSFEKSRSKSAQVAATCRASWFAALDRYQAYRDTPDNADITLTRWAQSMGKGIVSACEREYGRASAFVRAHKEGGAEGVGAYLLAALSDEQGDVRLLLNHAEADASWHDCLDACTGQYRAVLNWEEVRTSASTVGGLLVKLGARRCALAGIAAAKTALYGGEQAAWPIAVELLSAAFFEKSVEFPVKPRDYDLPLPIPARGLFFEHSAWPPPLSATTLYAALTHCIHSTLSSSFLSPSSSLSALPLCAALGHLARHVLKDVQRDMRAKALRARALSACGRVAEGARCIVGVMQGRDLASAVSEEGMLLVSSSSSTATPSPTYDARLPPSHEANQPCVGLISAGVVDADLATRYGADAMAELILARTTFLMCVGQRVDPALNRSEAAPAIAPKTPATQSKPAANAAVNNTPVSSNPWPLLDAAAQLLNRVLDDYGPRSTGPEASDSALAVYCEATRQLISIFQAQLKFTQALELTEKLQRLPSFAGRSNDRDRLRYAELCIEVGQTNRAREVCESVLNANDARSDAIVACAAHAMLAQICFNAGDYHAAAKQFDTATAANGDCCPSLLIASGEAHEHAGDTLTALERYRAGMERARAHLDTHGFAEMRAHAELCSGYIHTVPIAVKTLLCAAHLDAERELELCSEANELIGYTVHCPLWLRCLVKLTLGKAQLKSGRVGEAEESLISAVQAAVSDGGHDCEALRAAYIALAAIATAQRNHNRALVCLQTAARLAAMRVALERESSNLTVVNLTGVPSFIAQEASAAGSNAGQILYTQLGHLHRLKGRSVIHDSTRTRIPLLHGFLKTASPNYTKQCCMEVAADLPGDDAASSVAPGTIIAQWEDGDIATGVAQRRLIFVIGTNAMPTSGQRTYPVSTMKHLSTVAAKACASIESFTPEAVNEARLYAAQCLSKGHLSSPERDWRTSAILAQEKENWMAGDAMLSTTHWRLLEALVDTQKGLDCTDVGLAQWLSSVLTT